MTIEQIQEYIQEKIQSFYPDSVVTTDKDMFMYGITVVVKFNVNEQMHGIRQVIIGDALKKSEKDAINGTIASIIFEMALIKLRGN